MAKLCMQWPLRSHMSPSPLFLSHYLPDRQSPLLYLSLSPPPPPSPPPHALFALPSPHLFSQPPCTCCCAVNWRSLADPYSLPASLVLWRPAPDRPTCPDQPKLLFLSPVHATILDHLCGADSVAADQPLRRPSHWPRVASIARSGLPQESFVAPDVHSRAPDSWKFRPRRCSSSCCPLRPTPRMRPHYPAAVNG